MESTQQFHLKWNNHSLNTLSSFQQLLDSNTLVDVSLTCSNGKTVTAHRIVLAACSDYFYHLFRDLPEKHPVIVFKDANEEIVRDLLLFMYKGEVEVQESYLNDFLKFADTLQVKGLSQSDKNSSAIPPSAAAALAAAAAAAAANESSDKLSSVVKESSKPKNNNTLKTPLAASVAPTPPTSKQSNDQPIPLIKSNNNNNEAALPQVPPPPPPPHPSVQELAKNYLATLGKFPGMFPGPVNPEAALAGLAGQPPHGADIFSHLSSPNLYRALKRTYPDAATNPMFKQNPLFKKVFGDNPDFYRGDDADSDGIAERSPPPGPPVPLPPSSTAGPGLPGPLLPPTTMGMGPLGFSPIPGLMRSFPVVSPGGPADSENGFPDRISSPAQSDHSPYPPSSLSGANTPSGNNHDGTSPDPEGLQPKTNPDGSPVKRIGGSVKSPAGRGSRLERMIAAEYKIISEYSEMKADPAALPVMTPELMKSRRTHSLQLAIAEIMHNRASVQSAATKYHIPRETLRRHYQRYLKTMGIEKPPPPANNNGGSSPGNTTPAPPGGAHPAAAAAAVAAAIAGGRSNNNAKLPPGLPGLLPPPPPGSPGKDDGPPGNGFSSLMELGQAFGIWGPAAADSDVAAAARAHLEKVKAGMAAAAASASAGDLEKDKKLVIDEDDDVDDVEVDDEEPLSPGGPEDEQAKGGAPSPPSSVAPPPPPPATTSQQSEAEPMDQTGQAAAPSAAPPAPMEMSA